MFNSDFFWKMNIHIRYCEHKYKKGVMAGMFCGKKIDIICKDNKGKYKCYKHVSKTVYNSNKRKKCKYK